MPIIVAPHAGFCMGVKNAVDKARSIAKSNRRDAVSCYSLGEIIHNRDVVLRLQEEGLFPINSVEEAKDGLLLIRSHGVSKEVMEKAQSIARRVEDLTCPYVKRLHKLVADFSAGGKPIVIVGDRAHPEIIGIAGWCQGEVHIIYQEADIANLPESVQEALAVCQTTFQPDKWQGIEEKLKQRFPGIETKNTICSATYTRQKEAEEIAKRADKMIVVGGRGSANTNKLYETCKAYCENTILVERASEIPVHFMKPARDIIGITAGASTPDWLLKEVVDIMNDIERMESPETMEASNEAVVEPVAEATKTETENVAAQEEPKVEKSFMDQVADSMKRIRKGQTVQGKVVQITEDEVCVNIGYKSDGLIKRSDLVDKDVKLGDTIEVEIVTVNDGEGNVILSQRNIINRKVWADIKEKFEKGEYVDAVGKEAVKGGLLASVEGVRAFIPQSQVAPRYIEKLQQFVGQPMKLKILEIDEGKKRIVASRKEAILEEQNKAKEEAWAKLEEGAVVKGIVRRFVSFGAFVDLGGVDGLIHISDLSWNRTAAPQDILKVNEEIEVKILGLDKERERIQLGFKQLMPRPWDNIEEKYPVGTVLTRKVVRVRPFGAFIELEPGVDGLCHISQVSVNRINKVEDVLSPEQEVQVKVIAVDPESKRISLSIREALEDNVFDYQDEIPGMEYEEVYNGEEASHDFAQEEPAEEVPAEEAPATEEEASKQVSE